MSRNGLMSIQVLISSIRILTLSVPTTQRREEAKLDHFAFETAVGKGDRDGVRKFENLWTGIETESGERAGGDIKLTSGDWEKGLGLKILKLGPGTGTVKLKVGTRDEDGDWFNFMLSPSVPACPSLFPA